MANASPNPDGNAGAKPQWLAPVIVVLIVVVLVAVGRKRKEVIENPLVDFAILTVGVFAFAAAFRWVGAKLGSNGLAQFFGAPAQHVTPIA
jgi:di/tricarboxylate transporter